MKIRQLDVQKGTGPDDIPIKFIKMVGVILAPYLSEIFNVCYEVGVFPSSLKKAKVVPIHKGGSKKYCW